MIPLSSFADGDGTKTTTPKDKNEISASAMSKPSPAGLVVINLNESASNSGIPTDILNQFEDVMEYPKEIKDAADEECVLVGFTYDEEGYINVESTHCSNESFNDHVVKNIEKIRLRNGSVTIGKQYFAKFSFKKL